MKRLRSCALVLALAATLAAAESFFFVQATDPQFGMYADNANFEQETANFEFFSATVRRLKPAFVVVTGDLVNRPGDAAQTAEYLRIAKTLQTPVYNVPGNHDLGNTPTAESLAQYRAKFGRDYYSFRAGGAEFFVLDTPLVYDPSLCPEEEEKQRAWLTAELEKARRDGAQPLIVFQHHAWFMESPDEPDKYENIPRARRAIYLKLLAQYGVTYLFAGHYHQNATARYGPFEIVTTGPVGKPLRGAQSGMRIVTLGPAGLKHRYYTFGDLPNRIAE